MKKIVYNTCFGGFSLSTEAILLARKLSGNPMIWNCPALDGEKYSDGSIYKQLGISLMDASHHPDIKRDDPILVQVVEQLGDKAGGMCAELAIATVQGKWKIDEYDGSESVVEPKDIEWND